MVKWLESFIHQTFVLSCHRPVLSSVQLLSHVQLFAIPWIAAHQASLSITNSRSFSNSCPSSQWWHPNISSSIVPFSSCLQYFPASGPFPMSQFFTSGGWSIRVSASTSVLPMNIHDWFPLGLTGLLSLHSKGLSRVLFSTDSLKRKIRLREHLPFWNYLVCWGNVGFRQAGLGGLTQQTPRGREGCVGDPKTKWQTGVWEDFLPEGLKYR